MNPNSPLLKKSCRLSFFLIILITSEIYIAQAQFIVSAELRPRLEFRDGYRTLPTEDSKPAAFVSQRSRLNASYSQKKFSLKISLHDVRTWGDEGQTQNVPSLALHEAYGQI